MHNYLKIKGLVQEKLALSHNVIIAAVIQEGIRKHNDPSCNCEYCTELKKYVIAKIKAHKLKRALNQMDNDFSWDNRTYHRISSELYILNTDIKKIKINKDAIKAPYLQ